MMMRRKADHMVSAATDSLHESFVNAPGATRNAPTSGASWDPYEVWLTRVKQPRERSAPMAAKRAGRAASADAGTAARGTLTSALSR